MTLRPVSKTAARVLDFITRDLVNPSGEGESHRRIGNEGGGIMPVVVERIGERTYSVAHYFKQNGDPCADPEMTFLKQADGVWIALSFKQMPVGGLLGGGAVIGGEQCGVILNEDESIKSYYPRRARDQATFCTTWMQNIKEQQNLKLPSQPRKPRREPFSDLNGGRLTKEEHRMLSEMDAFTKANGHNPATQAELDAWTKGL